MIMKKILFICSLFIMTMTTKLIAQPNSDGVVDGADYQIWSWGTAAATGTQTVQVPGGKGSIKFVKQGEKFSNVIFTDAAGKTHRLQPSKPGTPGAPKASCKYPLPDACFATADKSIGMCICKPTDLNNSSGGDYSIGIMLPQIKRSPR